MNRPHNPSSGNDSSATRRNPSVPNAGAPGTTPETPQTTGHIIRRAPTGRIPIVTHTDHIARPPAAPAEILEQAGPSAKAAIATCAVTIISGWATAVVSTDLIAGWWRTDRLFCVAVAFLTLVFATTTISGVIMLLRRRLLGPYLIAAGAVVALLTFVSVFIAGARVPWIVHTIPVLQVASGVLAMHPATKRWLVAH